MPPVKHDQADTATRILDTAEALTQTRGFNGFSYADISQAVGITKASLHYHFRTKAELGRRLIERYHANFEAALSEIEGLPVSAFVRLERYVKLYSGVLQGERMCLCGMLAAEVSTLPEPMREEIRKFFDLNEIWLARILDAGRSARELAFDGAAIESARLLLETLEGSMLVARSYGEPQRFDYSARRLLLEFSPSA